MYLTYNDKKYIFYGTYDHRNIPQDAGFRWDHKAQHWYTLEPIIAAKLEQFADILAADKLQRERSYHHQAVAASHATESNLEVPAPEGLVYRPFQRAGVEYMLNHEGTLLGDDMGLGKTIQVIGLLNYLPIEEVQSVLIVCPASLKLNWGHEFRKWLVHKLTWAICQPKYFPKYTNILVINYDILDRYIDRLMRNWDVIVADESHYIKNAKSNRSKAFYSLKARRRLLLSGTPMPNRTKELFPQVHYLAPQTFPDFFAFGLRYCGGTKGAGWDFNGATNTKELAFKLRSTCMIRRRKADVLTELPPKVRQIVELPVAGLEALVRKEFAAYEQHKPTMDSLKAAIAAARSANDTQAYRQAVAALKAYQADFLGSIATIRREVAEAKVPYVVHFLKDAIRNAGKVICFAHHRSVVAEIYRHFATEAVVIIGDTPLPDRDMAVRQFQTNPAIKLFVGNMKAAGVGLTLTASSHVAFAELDWTPGNVIQAEDRAHRIGQTDSVNIYHLVLEGSLDAYMAERLIEKQAIIDATIG